MIRARTRTKTRKVAAVFTKEELSALHTPCFIFDSAELHSNFRDFNAALRQEWGPNACVAYSVKTNPFPWILDVAKECGCMAEVVSDDEYSLALDRGFEPDRIIFNGPVKGRAWFEFALKAGSIVNIDSRREVRWLQEISESSVERLKVGVRANIDLEKFCPGQTIGGSEPGRFGYSLEDGSLAAVIAQLREMPGVTISGLHMHVTTYGRFAETYGILSAHAAKIVRENSLSDIEYIDMGGGYYGGGERNAGRYEQYAAAITNELRDAVPAGCALYVEPGGAVICTPGYYVGKVVDVKDVRGTRFVVTELSRLNIDHEVKKTSYAHKLYTAEGRPTFSRQEICGFTCMESDRLTVLEGESELAEGDVVLIYFAGAYSMSFTPGFFIEHAPAVYKYENGMFQMLRDVFCKLPPKLSD